MKKIFKDFIIITVLFWLPYSFFASFLIGMGSAFSMGAPTRYSVVIPRLALLGYFIYIIILSLFFYVKKYEYSNIIDRNRSLKIISYILISIFAFILIIAFFGGQ